MLTVTCLTVVVTSLDDVLETGVMALTTGNDVSREWTQLDEHIMSANINDNHTFNFGNFSPSLKLGAYSEYRTRSYKTREFIYNWNAYSNNLPSDFRHQDIPTLLSDEQNFGADKLYMLEQVRYRNNYDGHNTLGAGYIAASLPFGSLVSTPVSVLNTTEWNSFQTLVTMR
jgi:hypothetical protein